MDIVIEMIKIFAMVIGLICIALFWIIFTIRLVNWAYDKFLS